MRRKDFTVAATKRRRPRALLAGFLLVLVPVAGLGALVYVAFLRSPDDAPEEFLREGRRAGTRTLVVSAGASTTHASASGDYVGMLRGRLGDDGYGFVNAGVNGDASRDLLGRVDEIVACRPDAVTVLIGTNDAREGGTGRAALEEFRGNLQEILTRLRTQTDSRVAVLSLPPLGEDLDDVANRRVARYNAVIEEVAAEQGAAYLPLNERLSDLIREAHLPHRSASGFSLWAVLRSAFLHYAERRSWDEVAARNGYAVLTDGVHLSDRGAKVAVGLIADWLSQSSRDPSGDEPHNDARMDADREEQP